MGISTKRNFFGFIADWLGLAEDEAPVVRPRLNPEMINRLKELSAGHTFVDVSFIDRGDTSYQSLILEVNTKQRYLVIDELYPLDDTVKISPGESIHISTHGTGMPVQFDSVISTIELVDGTPAYRISLPKSVKANQRRKFFRISLSGNSDVSMRFSLGENTNRLCTVTNLSAAGIGLRVSGDISKRLHSGGVIESAKLFMPGHEVVVCDLKVRSYEYRKAPQRETVMGCQLLSVSPQEQKVLDKFLLKMQRLEKKRQADNED